MKYLSNGRDWFRLKDGEIEKENSDMWEVKVKVY